MESDMDEESVDLRSVNLLESPSSWPQKPGGPDTDKEEEETSGAVALSPPNRLAAGADNDDDDNDTVTPSTQTLNCLSQNTTDLHYDMSQLEFDVAQTLAANRRRGGDSHHSPKAATTARALDSRAAPFFPEASEGDVNNVATTLEKMKSMATTEEAEESFLEELDPAKNSSQTVTPSAPLAAEQAAPAVGPESKIRLNSSPQEEEEETTFPSSLEISGGGGDDDGDFLVATAGHYNVHRVTIVTPGKLGIIISRIKAPEPLLETFFIGEDSSNGDDNDDGASATSRHSVLAKSRTRSSFVEEIKEGKLAEKCGLRAKDCFVVPNPNGRTRPQEPRFLLMEHSKVREVLKAGHRPLRVYVARAIVSSASLQPQFSTASTNDQSAPTAKTAGGAVTDGEDREARGDEDAMNPTKPITSSRDHHKTDSAKTPSALARKSNDNPQGRIDGDHDDDDVVPFCNKCNVASNGNARKYHHAWCPRHNNFEISGASAILYRLRRGCQVGCPRCAAEYRAGKPIGKATKAARQQPLLLHSAECLRLRPQGSQEEKQAASTRAKQTKRVQNTKSTKAVKPNSQASKTRKGQNRDQRKSSTGARKKPSKMQHRGEESSSSSDESREYQKSRRGRTIRMTEKLRSSTANLSDIGGDDSDESAYKGKTESRARSRGLETLLAESADREDASIAAKPTRTQPKTTVSKKTRAPKGQTQSRVPREGSGAENLRAQLSNHIEVDFESDVQQINTSDKIAQTNTSSFFHDEDSDDFTETEPLVESQWTSFDNVWGQAGSIDGDVVIYAPMVGIGGPEMMLSSQRYVSDPFSANSKYNKTHYAPKEGLHALILRRDTMALRPWGFSCYRHEFGGACLVKSVDPMSPADTAIHVADAQSTPGGLHQHDMIIAVNGTRVGGLTEESVAIALEAADSELLLLVSRYKIAAKTLQRIAAAERQYIDALDESMRDEHLLGWTELGDVGRQRDGIVYSHASVRTENGHLETTSPYRGCHVAEGVVASARDNGKDNMDNQSTAEVMGERQSKQKRGFASSGYAEAPRNGANEGNEHEKAGAQSETCQQNEAEAHSPPENDKRGVRRRPEMPLAGDDLFHETETNSTQTQEEETTESALDELSLAQVDDAKSCTGTPNEETTMNSYQPITWIVCKCDKIGLFSIQCDICDTWCSVHPECVGFDQEQAESIERWMCWVCAEQDDSNNERSTSEELGESETQPSSTACKTQNGTFEASQARTATKATKQQRPMYNAQKGSRSSGTEQGRSSYLKRRKDVERRTHPDGCIEPKTAPLKRMDGTFNQPGGRVPKGYSWDETRGLYVPSTNSDSSNGASRKKKRDPESEGASLSENLKITKKKRAARDQQSESEEDDKDFSQSQRTCRRKRFAPPEETSDSESYTEKSKPKEVFAKGDLVEIQEHGWSGTSNSGGIAHVTKAEVDTDGDVVYDVKYVVGRTARGVLSRFVSRYDFDAP